MQINARDWVEEMQNMRLKSEDCVQITMIEHANITFQYNCI